MESRRPPADEGNEKDLLLARHLARYVDRFAAEGRGDPLRFLSANPHLSGELAGEIEAFEWIGSLVDEKPDEPVTFGDFQVIRVAGRGGMGIVYEAKQVSLDRRVALKVLLSVLLADPRAVARFYREAKLTASLAHPSIVPVHAMGVEAGCPYFAMEFVEGVTLEDLLCRGEEKADSLGYPDEEAKRLALAEAFSPPRLAVEPALQDGASGKPSRPAAGAPLTLNREYCLRVASSFAGLAEGLQYAHSLKVIHRDIKPSNLIFDRDRKLKILDFGLACLEGEEGITFSRERLGTPLYMSPEQVRRSPHALTHSTDIYSLGATLYEMLTLQPPLEGEDQQETLYRIVHWDPLPLRRLNPEVPPALENVVLKCLRKDPADRYGTAEALAQDLWRFTRGDPVEALPEPALQVVARRVWRQRSRIAALCGVAAVLLLAVISVWLGVEERRKRILGLFQAGVRRAVLEIPLRPLLVAAARNGSGGAQGTPFTLVDTAPPSSPRRLREEGGHPRVFETGSPLVETGAILRESVSDPLLEAVRQLEDSVKLLPDDPSAYYHLARGLALLGEERKALERLSTALQRSPRFIPALSLRATLLEKLGSLEAAAAHNDLERAAAASPESWGKSWFEAHQATLRRDWKAAGLAYGKIIRSQAGRSEPYLGSLVETRLERGLALLLGGDLDGALADFAAAGEISKGAMQPSLLQGKVYYLKDQAKRAQEGFLELYEAETGAQARVVALAVAETCRELGDFEQALEWLGRSGTSTDQLCLKAEVLRHLGEKDQALQAAQEAVDGDPRSFSARLTLGNSLLALGRFDDALRRYSEAGELDPKSPLFRIARGVCLYARNSPEEAIQALEEAIAASPRLAEPHYNLGLILSHQGRLEEARKEYEKSLQSDPGHPLALNNLGVLLEHQGDPEGAQDCFRRAAEAAPTLAVAHFNRGWSYQRSRQYLDAIQAYRRASKLGLDTSSLRNNLGACLEKAGFSMEALVEYRRAFELDPGDPLICHGLGSVQDTLNHWREAEEAYRRAVELEPRWAMAHHDLGKALLELGRFQEAELELFAAIACNPQGVWAYGDLAREIHDQRRPLREGAQLRSDLQAFEDASRLPNSSMAIELLVEKHRKAASPRLLTFASVDALWDEPQPLEGEGVSWKASREQGAPSRELEWSRLGFDDSRWESGEQVLGSGKPPDPAPEAPSGCYLRGRFRTGASGVKRLWLFTRISHGFAAYLNGSPVARWRSGNGEWFPSFTDRASALEEEWAVRRFPLDTGSMLDGENLICLAIQGESKRPPSVRELPSIRVEYRDAAGIKLRARAALQAWKEAGAQPEDAGPLAYLEGRLLQADGCCLEAESRFRAAAAAAPDRPEPILRLKECFRTRGEDLLAERCLLLDYRPKARTSEPRFEAWFQMVLTELCWSPERILEAMPVTEPLTGPEPANPVATESARWLLGELAAGRPLRINCGGAALRGRRNLLWGEDRFFRGGMEIYHRRLVESDPGRSMDPVYQTSRNFWIDLHHRKETRTIAAYRVPLPAGQYRVLLHFLEPSTASPPTRFDILLEDKVVEEAYQPGKSGARVPDVAAFTVLVNDGALDLGFGVRTGYPEIFGLEIEKL
jgi:serine/threonine protein kinase/tetratricopeptide (TPR) repeat protein